MTIKLGDPAGADGKRQSVLDMLNEMCPRARFTVDDHGIIKPEKAGFCGAAEQDPPVTKNCVGLCGLVSSPRTVTIRVKTELDWAGGGYTGPMELAHVDGTGADTGVCIENQSRWRERRRTADGEWVWNDVPDWLILAHELCDHAGPMLRGAHPPTKQGHPGNDWHKACEEGAKQARRDHGLPEPGKLHSPKF